MTPYEVYITANIFSKIKVFNQTIKLLAFAIFSNLGRFHVLLVGKKVAGHSCYSVPVTSQPTVQGKAYLPGPRSSTTTCRWLETSTRSSRLVLQSCLLLNKTTPKKQNASKESISSFSFFILIVHSFWWAP